MMLGAFLLMTAAADQVDAAARDDGRLVLRVVATCMAREHLKEARAFIEADEAAPLSKAQLSLIEPDCLPRIPPPLPTPGGAPLLGTSTQLTLSSTRSQYQGAVAEAVLHRMFRKDAPMIRPDLPALEHRKLDPSGPTPAGWTAGPQAWASEVQRLNNAAELGSFGECVVRASPTGSWAVLQTEVASKAETEALHALTPTLAQCLAANRTVKFGKSSLRGSIALNFYRLATAGGAL